MKRYSPHFKKSECLVSSKFPELAAKLEPSPTQEERMRMICNYGLEPLRAAAKIIIPPDEFFGIEPTSFFRDYDLNVAVGGHVDSHHMQLRDDAAVDIVINGLTPRQIVDLYLETPEIMPCQFLLIYPGFVHLNYGPWPQLNEVRYKR